MRSMPLARHVLLHSRKSIMPVTNTSFNDQISDATREIGIESADLSGSAVNSIDEHRDAAADGIDKAASALHENAESLPGGEKVARLAHTAADKLGDSAQYIRQNDARRMMTDAKTLVKNNPGPSLLAAAFAGFLVGRAFRGHN